jgi:asparagine N-glycosylation enzyme membrane subunit Stt3
MLFTFSLLITAGAEFTVLTTSDSGFFYGVAREIDERGGMITKYDLSHPPSGLPIGMNDQLQPIMLVMLYRGVHSIFPSISLMDVVKFYSPLFFMLSLIPVFLIGRELGGDLAGCSGAFFLSVLTSSIYWTKIGAFDREATQLFFAAWTIYLTVKMFRAPRDSILKIAVIAGLVYGLFSLTWSGFLFLSPVIVGGLILALLRDIPSTWSEARSVEKAILSSVRLNLHLISGVVGMFAVTAIVGFPFGYSISSWAGFITQILEFVGIVKVGGVSFPKYASEMQAPGNYYLYVVDLYGQQILANFVLLLIAFGLIKIVWSKRKEGLILIPWLVVVAAMSTSQARFFRLWWPVVAVLAGVGVSAIASAIRGWSLRPSFPRGAWKAFRRPLALALCCVVVITPFIQNARAEAQEVLPHGGTSGAVYKSLLDCFEWIRENTPENSIVAVEWSYGHLLTGAAARRSVVDGAEILGKEGEWENKSDVRPPDYIWRESDGQAVFVGGRRIDIQEIYNISKDNELAQMLLKYKEKYDIKIDYIVFNLARVADALLSIRRDIQTSKSVNYVEGKFVFDFDGENVVLDPQQFSVHLQRENENLSLAGIIYYLVQTGGLMYDFNPSPEIEKVLWVFIDENYQVAGGQLAKFEGVPMVIRVRNGLQMPDFLEREYFSPNGFAAVYKVVYENLSAQ